MLSNVSGSWTGTKFLKTEMDAKAAHGYTSTPKTLKEVEDKEDASISELEKKVGSIIFEGDSYAISGFRNSINGGFNATEGYKYTAKKWVAAGSVVTVTGSGTSTVAILAVYDKNDAFIAGESVPGNSALKTATITIGTGGRYIIASTLTTEIPNSGVTIYSVFVESSELTTILEDYATKTEVINNSDLTLGVGSNIS